MNKPDENKDDYRDEESNNAQEPDSDESDSAPRHEEKQVESRNGQTAPMANAGFTRASSKGTRIANEESDNEMDFLPERIGFTGKKGLHYTVDFSRELGRGGEAVVVVAYDDSEQEFAAKVYNMPQTRREQRNHNSVLEILSSGLDEFGENYRSTHLMPLLEYGTITATMVGEERPGEYNISIMPKCDCLGNRALSREDVKKRIIPSLAEALKTLHSQNIVHRDVKPSNIYEYNGVVVLGDYGISTVLDGDTNLKDTHTNRGTAGYWLPVGYVEPRGDWYSLGYTIWTMYDNRHPHQDLIDAGNLLGNVYAGKRIVPFEPKSDEDASLRDLIYGLTTVYAEKRLGYDDIQRWISNPADFEFKDPGSEDVDGWRYKYEFNTVKTANGSQLAQALSSNWDFAIQHLFDGNDLVEHFSRNGENDTSTKLRVIVREYAGVKQDLGMAKAIFLISGSDERMTWKGKDVSFPAVVSDFISNPADELVFYDELFRSGFLSWALREGGLDATDIDANTVKLIEDVSKDNPRFARGLFQHLFAGGGTSDYAGFKSSDDLIGYFVGDVQRLYSLMGQIERLEPCVAALAPFYVNEGKLEKLATSMRSFGGSPLCNMDSFLSLLEAIDEKGVVVEFALNYGPSAPWFWLSRNISLYEIRNEEGSDVAKDASKSLANVGASVPSTIKEVSKCYEEAKFQAERIRQRMDPSPVPSFLGIKTDKPVVAKCDDAYFCSDFYGDVVPRGFVRHLALSPGVNLACWPEVNLLSKSTIEETGYLESAKSQCDNDLAKCEEAGCESESKAAAVFRLILDIALLLIMLLVVPSLSEVLVPVAASFLGLFDGTLEAGNIFTQFTIAVLCAAIAFDGVLSFWSAKGSSTISIATKEIESLKAKLEQESSDFQTGTSDFAKELKDPSGNGRRTSLGMSEALASATNSALSVVAQNRSFLYMIIWHVAAVISVTYLTTVALVVLMPLIDIPPWISVLVIFAGVVAAYGWLCWMCGKVGSWLYTGYGLLAMVGVALCAIAIAVALIFLVLALLAVVVAIGGLVLGCAILFGLFSS